jgi:glutamate mutase epsilon subunit
MTHQKIHAEEKWGHKQITEESIEEMLSIAEESDYEYKDFYISSLEQWQAGNFEDAVKVHNIICNANDGTVGKAERLLSPAEEEAYIKEHFE